MDKKQEEVKEYIKMLLKNRPDNHVAWALAEKYDLNDFFIKQCKRYSIDPDFAKKKVITCRVFTNECLEIRRKIKNLLNEE